MAQSTENGLLDAVSIARRYRNGNGNGSIWNKTVTLLQLMLSLIALAFTMLGVLISFSWSQSRWETNVSDHLQSLERDNAEMRAFAEETRRRQEAVQARLATIEVHDALTVQRFETMNIEHQHILDAIRGKK